MRGRTGTTSRPRPSWRRRRPSSWRATRYAVVGGVTSGKKKNLVQADVFRHLPSGPAVLPPSLQLPDGRVIKVGSERFEAAEALFQPHLVDVEAVGMAEQLYNTIQVRGR